MSVEHIQSLCFFHHSVPCRQSNLTPDSQFGLVSEVTRHPLKVSILTSPPHSTSTTARYTSPLFPLRLCTATSPAVTRPIEVPWCPSSWATLEAVNGRTLTGFQEDDPEEARRARKYASDEVRASDHAASSLRVSYRLGEGLTLFRHRESRDASWAPVMSVASNKGEVVDVGRGTLAKPAAWYCGVSRKYYRCGVELR